MLKLIVLLYISNKEIENEILKKYIYNIKKQHKAETKSNKECQRPVIGNY